MILTLMDRTAWDDALERAGGGDVYHLATYHAANEEVSPRRAHAFVFEDGVGSLFYPFMLGEVPGTDVRDIETVYGYTGPVTTNVDRGWLANAWDAFARWCRDSAVIAEFVRFNPCLGNEIAAPSTMTVRADRPTVEIDLSGGAESIWNEYPSTQRNMVRKARAHGLVCREVPFTEGIAPFRRLYDASMERLGASQEYFFSDAYFEVLSTRMQETVRVFAVMDGSTVVAAAIFLVYRDRIHYHLAGSDAAHRSAGPNNLLLDTVAQWGADAGYRRLHLGGGRTPLPDDALLSFKSSVSDKRLTFFVGKLVHDERAYSRLCSEWMNRHQPAARPNYFLLYRQ